MSNYFPKEFLQHSPEKKNRLKVNSQLPRISVVMPTYRQGKFIEKSILSILNQQYPNTELIVIDGGSDDCTIEVLKKYENEISYWITEKDFGQSDALNKGFKKATGEIYGWLNSDDLYLPGTFKKVLSAFSENSDKFLIFGDWLTIDENDFTIDLNHAFDFSLNHFKYESFHLNAQSMFWRSSVHKKFSGFDINLHNTMDYQMILEFGINQGQASFHRIPNVLGAFRRYDGQKTNGFTPLVLDEHFRIASKYGYLDKYSYIGKAKRFFYRMRRFWWYLKRGGLSGLSKRLIVAYL